MFLLFTTNLSIVSRINGNHNPTCVIVPHSNQEVKKPDKADVIAPNTLAHLLSLRLSRYRNIKIPLISGPRKIIRLHAEEKGIKKNKIFRK